MSPTIPRLSFSEKPALPNSYFWTWDHSTNWVLDDAGAQVAGCYNSYVKQPETYVEDYRRLTNLCANLGIKGIAIWGFLRDAHGGVESAKRVASYAASKDVAIMPGFGTTWYGGAYYEGDHPYSLTSFLKKYPDAVMVHSDGTILRGGDGIPGANPTHPAYREWLQGALRWMMREFDIGGLNIENGDFLMDYSASTLAARKAWPADDPDTFFFQGLSYKQALDAIADELPRKLVAYATYTGFNFSDALAMNAGMGKQAPAMFKVLPPQGVAQWTLTGMVREKPLPLTEYLDDGAPAAAFDNPRWAGDARPPGARGVGFVHQGSQWAGDRHACVVGVIKEACLRAHRSGLEGVSIHGEVSDRHVPAALNYLAFAHFTHRPEDSLREFGRQTLGQVLESAEDGEHFVELLAQWDAGMLDASGHKQIKSRAGALHASRGDLARWQRERFWKWLQIAACCPLNQVTAVHY
jgi:hypothetical protein